MQAMTATLVRHLKEQRRNFSIIITRISSHVCCPLEERGVRFLSLSFSSSEDLYLYHAMVCFFPLDQYQTKPKT